MAKRTSGFCYGCKLNVGVTEETTYRNHSWCGNQSCKDKIDERARKINSSKKNRSKRSGSYRKGVSRRKKQMMRDRYGNNCFMCKSLESNENILECHHIVPVSEGGSDNFENLSLLCRKCHSLVHDGGWENYVHSITMLRIKNNKFITDK